MSRRSLIAFSLVATVTATALVSIASPAGADICVDTALLADGNGKLVSVELRETGTLYGMLRARASAMGPWERFRICQSDGIVGQTTWTIQSLANGKYVSAELGYAGSYSGLLRARSSTVGRWERFRISGDGLSLRLASILSLANGRYVSTEIGETGSTYAMLRARAISVGPWERYRSCSC